MTSTLPPLEFEPWRSAKNTLHLWCQIVGKTKLGLTPRRNHWWNVTLQVSARGLTTGRLPASTGNLEVEIDLVDHRIRARTTDGDGSFSLADCLTVAEFHERFAALLGGLGVRTEIKAEPFGVPMTTPFPDDVENRSYDADAAGRFLRALQWSGDVFDEFSGWFCGKTSPVHVFWHSFDLAVTRFSGRRAPAIPGADPVTAEAYSHEVVSFGFWPGDDVNRFPAYYSYTAPEPPGLRDQPIRPAPAAGWIEQRGGSLAVLPYDDVRAAADPRATLLDFLQSTYEAGAGLAGWDLDDTRTDWCPILPIGDHRG